jgi:hypothetical protein
MLKVGSCTSEFPGSMLNVFTRWWRRDEWKLSVVFQEDSAIAYASILMDGRRGGAAMNGRWVDEGTYGWNDRWMKKLMDGRTGDWRNLWMEGQMYAWTYGWMKELTDGMTRGWRNLWMEGQGDEGTYG